ncbi:conserved hypothetical protein [Trichophyton verrucosum HKI 0517]|uniref:Extracellular mutant protein 11 C-terminal domain-containing protein n=1 Tax=Trichophyton verrucosum (strain HKI 0517) TaxID=663202 RepID=D4D1S6_TRIVH|nr:uncharacterized protein TRV_01028 [Trichophyton verrucosum HKI 0517]EFE44201.1 conserved hypothetical protein [Trichophyton verrucosum HKI 0517]
MRVSDFVQGGRDSNGIEKRLPKPVQNSRERQVELAKIKLPPAPLGGLHGFNRPSINKEHRNSLPENTTSNGLPGKPPQDVNTANQNEGPGDIFDTDLEGVDDSTTTFSVLRDTEAGSVAGNPYYAHEDTSRPGTAVAQNNGGYKSIAERIKELDSDEEGNMQGTNDYDQAHQGQEGFREQAGNDHREHDSGWEANNAHSTKETLSWQKIEAILREDTSSPNRNVDGEGTSHPNSQNLYQAPIGRDSHPNGASSTTQPPQNNHFEVPKITPRPVAQRLSTRNRFAARPHFAAPDPYSGHAEEPNQEVEENLVDQELHHSVDDQSSAHNRGAFDTATDLSAVDYSDDDGFEEMARHEEHVSLHSPHLSTVSAISSKRPYSNFISDYPPNILETKAFSDLQAESFDFNPTPVQPLFQHDSQLSLKDKLLRLKNLTDDQRRVFFSSVTISEWEECGDLLVDEFCQMLQKSKEVRQARRDVAAIFEAEIKRRHDAVEAEGNAIKNRLEDMKAGGLGVLKRQIP